MKNTAFTMTMTIQEIKESTTWKTASQMRERAYEVESNMLNVLLNNLMKNIEEKADKGKFEGRFPVNNTRPKRVYEAAQIILRTKGYEVRGECPNTATGNIVWWDIAW